jgi:hypothetical protein
MLVRFAHKNHTILFSYQIASFLICCISVYFLVDHIALSYYFASVCRFSLIRVLRLDVMFISSLLLTLTASSFFFFFTDSADAYSLYRSIKKSDEDIPVPPLIKSAALWGTVLISPLLSLRCIFIDSKYSNMVWFLLKWHSAAKHYRAYFSLNH